MGRMIYGPCISLNAGVPRSPVMYMLQILKYFEILVVIAYMPFTITFFKKSDDMCKRKQKEQTIFYLRCAFCYINLLFWYGIFPGDVIKKYMPYFPAPLQHVEEGCIIAFYGVKVACNTISSSRYSVASDYDWSFGRKIYFNILARRAGKSSW